jgi:transcription antitermination factor NusG
MSDLHPGDRVLILHGPFDGVKATVERVDLGLRLAYLRLELWSGRPVTTVEPIDRLRRLGSIP